MDQNRVEELKKAPPQIRLGGKGTPRGVKKVASAPSTKNDKKFENVLKKLSILRVSGVGVVKEGGTVIQFNNPILESATSGCTYVVKGNGLVKSSLDLSPEFNDEYVEENLDDCMHPPGQRQRRASI